MWLIDKLAEQRIAEAEKRGDFNGLRGEGKALNLNDDCLVPDHLRVAYRILKNAGYVPPELEARKEIINLQQLISALNDDSKQKLANVHERLNFLLAKFNIGPNDPIINEYRYFNKLHHRVAVNRSRSTK